MGIPSENQAIFGSHLVLLLLASAQIAMLSPIVKADFPTRVPTCSLLPVAAAERSRPPQASPRMGR